MKNYIKTNTLTLLALLAGLTYAYLLFNIFASDWDGWKITFNEKALGAEYNQWGDVIDHHPVESYELLIRARKGYASFPDSIVNLVENKTIKAKYNDVVVLTTPKEVKESWIVTLIFGLLGLVFLIVSILIPVHFYKIIGFIKRGLIFDRKNIYLLRKLGFELLLMYVLGVFFLYKMYHDQSSLFRFSEYEIVTPPMDPTWMMLGIVALMMAEILARAIALKEEQELTI